MKEIVACLRRQTGTVIRDLDRDLGIILVSIHRHVLSTGFESISAHIEENTIKLVAIGLDGEIGRDFIAKSSVHAVCRVGHRLSDIIDERGDDKALTDERRRRIAGEVERTRAQRYRAVDRREQCGSDATDLGRGAVGKSVGDQTRGRQDAAQIMVDLGHRGPESGEPGPLPQGLTDGALHHRELVFGDADLIGPTAGDDVAAGILGVRAECRHRRGDPAHRPDEQPLQADIDERRRDQRDEDRELQDADAETPHLVAHRLFVKQHLDRRVRVLGRLIEDAQNAILRTKQRDEGIADGGHETDIAQVECGIDLWRHLAVDHQRYVVALVQYDPERSDMGKELIGERLAHHIVRRRLEREDREMAGGDLAFEISDAETPDRRREDHHLAEHHEENREDEEARREAAQYRR